MSLPAGSLDDLSTNIYTRLNTYEAQQFAQEQEDAVPQLQYTTYAVLLRSEQFWVKQHDFLLRHGYQLRPRYTPGWTHSWKGLGHVDWSMERDFEDGQIYYGTVVMDATRLSDGAFVMLKRLRTPSPLDPPQPEVEIATLLHSGDMANDPRNHSVPLNDLLPVPGRNEILMVMPLLLPFDHVPFDTVGEVVDCLQQLFEGLQYMHDRRVAHRDIGLNNVMIDANVLYTQPWHPVANSMRRDWLGKSHPSYTRTQRPCRYYYIDFGLSARFDAVGMERRGDLSDDVPSEYPAIPGDKSVPEFRGDGEDTLYNPFPTDIYLLGNLIRGQLLDGTKFQKRVLGLEFLRPLIADMVNEDPAARPDIDEAMRRFQDIRSGLNTSALRARVVDSGKSAFAVFFSSFGYWFRRTTYALYGVPPVPI